jgi:hypothetical protein
MGVAVISDLEETRQVDRVTLMDLQRFAREIFLV